MYAIQFQYDKTILNDIYPYDIDRSIFNIPISVVIWVDITDLVDYSYSNITLNKTLKACNLVPCQWMISNYFHEVHIYRQHEPGAINTLRPRQNGRRFADNTFKRIFLNENVSISIKISLKFVPKGSIYNNPALGQIMAWRRSGGKPLSEPMMISLLKHICVTRPQWVDKSLFIFTRHLNPGRNL